MGPGVGYDGEKLPDGAVRSVLGAEIEPGIDPDRSCVKSRLILRPAWIGPAGATLDARRCGLWWWPPLGPLWEPRGRMCIEGRFCVSVGIFRLAEKLGEAAGGCWGCCICMPCELAGICSEGIPPADGVKPASSELSKSRLSCMFCARMYCCSLVRYVSSISSYMDSSCTISRVICRALPVRCLCRLEARLADSMRASRLRSLRRDAAMNALCRQSASRRQCGSGNIPLLVLLLGAIARGIRARSGRRGSGGHGVYFEYLEYLVLSRRGHEQAKLNNCSIPPGQSQARTGGAVHGSRRAAGGIWFRRRSMGLTAVKVFCASVQETTRAKSPRSALALLPMGSRRRRQSRFCPLS